MWFFFTVTTIKCFLLDSFACAVRAVILGIDVAALAVSVALGFLLMLMLMMLLMFLLTLLLVLLLRFLGNGLKQKAKLNTT